MLRGRLLLGVIALWSVSFHQGCQDLTKSLTHLSYYPIRDMRQTIVIDPQRRDPTNPKWMTFNGPDSGRPAWSPDGNWIAYEGIGATATASIWIVSPDGKTLATASLKVIQFWSVAKIPVIDRATLVASACARMFRNFDLAQWSSFFGNEPYRPLCDNLTAPQ